MPRALLSVMAEEKFNKSCELLTCLSSECALIEAFEHARLVCRRRRVKLVWPESKREPKPKPSPKLQDVALLTGSL